MRQFEGHRLPYIFLYPLIGFGHGAIFFFFLFYLKKNIYIFIFYFLYHSRLLTTACIIPLILVTLLRTKGPRKSVIHLANYSAKREKRENTQTKHY